MAQDISIKTERSLPIALLRAREAVMVPVRVMLNDLKVTEQQWRVLRVLEEEGPLGPTELAQRAVLLLPSLTRILQGLEARGLVERQAVESDRRRQKIVASAEGQKLIRDNITRAQEISRELRQRFGEDRHDQLLDLLNDLVKTSETSGK